LERVLWSAMLRMSIRSTFTTLPPASPSGAFGARTVARIGHEARHVARPPFLLLENEGARAHDLGHRLGGVEAGQPGGHHDRDLVAGAAERLDDEGERPAQLHRELPGIDRTQLSDRVHHGATERIALRPSLDRGDTVLGRHRRAVVPGQPSRSVKV
jgi:hypothetical protein